MNTSQTIAKEVQFQDEIMRDRVIKLRNDLEFYKAERDVFLERIKIKIKSHLYELEVSSVLAKEDIEFDYDMARSYHKKAIDCEMQMKALEDYLYP